MCMCASVCVLPSEACGPDATCINRPSGVGYDCRCHLGKSGHKCMTGKDSVIFVFVLTKPVEILTKLCRGTFRYAGDNAAV